jgi:peroxiredoxin
MDTRQKLPGCLMILGVLLAGVLAVTGVATAQEDGRKSPGVGEPAPDFTLLSTTGEQIRLSQFQGKQLVLLEFYGVDFAPT